MPFLPDVTRRRLQPEVMDQPGLPADLHADALRGLGRINWLRITRRTRRPSNGMIGRSRKSPRSPAALSRPDVVSAVSTALMPVPDASG